MGGKNDEVAPPPAAEAPADNTEMMMGLLQMMMSAPAFQAPEVPQLPDAPAVEADPVVDWSVKNQQLLAKTKADYQQDQKGKRGRTSTILTSPLLDDTIGSDSLLTGG